MHSFECTSFDVTENQSKYKNRKHLPAIRHQSLSTTEKYIYNINTDLEATMNLKKSKRHTSNTHRKVKMTV
jgi:hypothetical protein